MAHPLIAKFLPVMIVVLALSGCVQPSAPPVTTQETVEPKQTACTTDVDCVPDPSQCHARSCVTKTAAEELEPVEICTMLFDYQAAYSPEDCACELGKCVNKNLGRTGDFPAQ